MVVLLGFRQSQKVALAIKFSERTDHELQETILHHRSIYTGTSVPSTIFEADTDHQKRLFLGVLTIFDQEMRFRGEKFLQIRIPRQTPVRSRYYDQIFNGKKF